MTNDLIVRVPHPGERIKKELQKREITQKDFASEIDKAQTHLNEIIKGKRSITADWAILFEASLGLNATELLHHQMMYDLEQSRIQSENIKKVEKLERWKKLKEWVPLSFFKKHNLLSGDLEKDEQRIYNIYSVQTLDELIGIFLQPQYAKFRKSEKFTSNKINIIAWVRLVEYLSRLKRVEAFDPNKQEAVVEKLKKILLGSNVIQNTEQVLADAGIKLIIHPKPDQAPIDGIAIWEGENPCIGLSLRYKRIDNFAFTLLHEIKHVYTDLINSKSSEYIDVNIFDEEEAISKEEKEANQFARESLIPNDKWNEFVHTNKDNFDDYTIYQFALENEVHPASVRGRLCHEDPSLYKTKTEIDYSIR